MLRDDARFMLVPKKYEEALVVIIGNVVKKYLPEVKHYG